MNRVRILGIGSPSGDDQAGWLTVDALLANGVPTDVDCHKLDRPGASLIPQLDNADWVILIDAMQSGAQVGHIQRFDRQDWPGYGHGLSSHGVGVLDALSLAQALNSLPPRIDLYGIEIATVKPGDVAGEPVQAAAQRLARLLADALRLARPE